MVVKSKMDNVKIKVFRDICLNLRLKLQESLSLLGSSAMFDSLKPFSNKVKRFSSLTVCIIYEIFLKLEDSS